MHMHINLTFLKLPQKPAHLLLYVHKTNKHKHNK